MKKKVKIKNGYRIIPLSFTRRMVIASVNGNKKNAIHCITEIDVSEPRKLRKEHFEKTGEKLSFTAYIVKCFAEAIKDFPQINSFIRGNKLILLDDITISVLVERNINGMNIPEPIGIRKTQDKSIKQIHQEIRKAQKNKGNELGDLGGTTWVKFIPGFLLRTFIKIADRNIKMAKCYGKIAVTAVGMFSDFGVWFIPHGTATVLLTIGSLNKKNILDISGSITSKEFLCITASFDHEIIDGAPAARFMNRFEKILKSGELLISDHNKTQKE